MISEAGPERDKVMEMTVEAWAKKHRIPVRYPYMEGFIKALNDPSICRITLKARQASSPELLQLEAVLRRIKEVTG